MHPNDRGRPEGRPQQTTRQGTSAASIARRADNSTDPTRVQRWATAWLAADHTDDNGCPACTAGWALIDGGGRDG